MKLTTEWAVALAVILAVLFLSTLSKKVHILHYDMPEEINLIEPGDRLVCDSVRGDTVFLSYDKIKLQNIEESK